MEAVVMQGISVVTLHSESEQTELDVLIGRRFFAAHLLEDGYDIQTIQELLGRKDASKTMVYTYVLNRNPESC